MVMLYGRGMSRRDLARYAGALSQFAGVRLMTLGDGVERGVRMLEFRTGSGFRFSVLVDRGMDIGDCDHRGRAIGWHSPTGFRHPGLNEAEAEKGLGWLRSFSGLLVTCGLDHYGFNHEESGAHYHYVHRPMVRHTIHGRVGGVPARLGGYGERWDGDECTLWCEGVVQQATMFGEDLHLIRRIEAPVGGNVITISDRVVNHGFYRTPHMILYHVNIGHPVLAEGARYVAPVAETVFASHAGETFRRQGVGYRRLPGPLPSFHEQVWQHDMSPDAEGWVRAGVINDTIGLGFLVESRKSELPCHYEWQDFQEGQYAIGVEPATNHILGHGAARERGELVWLEHAEARTYTTRLRVLDGASEIGAAEAAIRAAAVQAENDFPEPTGRFADLSGFGREGEGA
jgi:hypothetical protein